MNRLFERYILKVELTGTMKRFIALVYLPLTIVYLAMSIIYPTDPKTIAARHLSIGEARVIALSLAIPLVIIWLFAFYGSWRLKQYSDGIKQFKDGKAISILANGILILSLYLPIRAVSKILLNYLAYLHPSLTNCTNLVITYINVLLPLIAYLLISQAARKLLSQAKVVLSLKSIYGLILLFCIIGAIYFNNVSSMAEKLNPSDWLVSVDYGMVMPIRILTIIVPFLFMWTIGIFAAYEIYLYQKNVKGLFYRQSFTLLSIGLILEIVASFLSQYVTTFGESLRKLPTAASLIIVYAVLILLAVGYALIASGVRKLKKLESS